MLLVKKHYKTLLLLLVLLGCADEDPSLVNPPLPRETIRIRFLNAVKGSGTLILDLNKSVQSKPVGYLELSDTLKPPPSDSVTMSFKTNGNSLYDAPRKLRLVRDTRYLIIAGESFRSNGTPDTLIVLYTTIGLPTKQFKSYFKFLNLVKDSTIRYSVVLGCPNGKVLVGGSNYFAYPILQTVESGSNTISIVQEQNGNKTLLNLYEINFAEDKEYTLFVAKEEPGRVELFLIDDYDNSSSAIRKLEPLQDRAAYVRTINFSTETVSLTKLPQYPITQNLASGTIDSYNKIPVCESDFSDSLKLSYSGGDVLWTNSFEINKKYSVFVFDSLDKVKVIPSNPVTLREPLNGRSLVRVINALDDSTAVTLSLGARASNNQFGFVSGEVLASKLKSNRISSPVVIAPGYLPLTLFSSSEPNILLQTGTGEFLPNRSYVIAIYKDSKGEIQFSIVEENDENAQVKLLPRGYFLQIANANPELQNASIKIQGILDGAILKYKESASTILPLDVSGFSINGRNFPVAPDLGKRGMILIAGDSNEVEALDFSIPSMGTDTRTYRRRFINACKFVPSITIRATREDGELIVEKLIYGSQSKVENIPIERKLSLFIINDLDGKTLAQFNDVYLTFGKNYTLVFTGSRNQNYSLIVMQEY